MTGAPVHVLLTGQPDERDRRLVVRNAPTFGMVNQDLNVTLRVDDTGAAPGEMAELRFRQQEVGERTLSVPVGRDIAVPFKLPRAGRSLLEFEVLPVPAELTPLNNRVARAHGNWAARCRGRSRSAWAQCRKPAPSMAWAAPAR